MPIVKYADFKGGEAFLSAAADGQSNLMPEASLHYAEMQPGEEVVPHTHDRVEIYAVLSGRARALSGGVITEVTAGDAVISPIGAAHALFILGSEPFCYYAFNAPPASTAPMVPAPEDILRKWEAAK